MALADGSSTLETGLVTLHTETAIDIAEKMTKKVRELSWELQSLGYGSVWQIKIVCVWNDLKIKKILNYEALLREGFKKRKVVG